MSYNPISGYTIQTIKSNGQVASDYYLKFYEANTTTPLSMATDSSGGTLLVKAKLNDNGMPISNPLDDSTVFIPHLNARYRLVIYLNETDADADDTASAFVNIPDASPVADGVITKLDDFSEFEGFTGSNDDQQISVKSWHPGSDVGGGIFYWDGSQAKSNHNGGTIISPTVPWTSTTPDFLNGVGETDSGGTGCWVRKNIELMDVTSWGLILNSSYSDTTTAAANTAVCKAYRDYLAPNGGQFKMALGDHVIALDSTTVAKDTKDGIGCAFELVSWVDVLGVGMATGGGTEPGSRWVLADGQNCSVLGNYENTLNGLSGCWMDRFTVKGNRAGNVTSGHGISIGSIFTGTGFGVIKIGDCRQKGIKNYAVSVPIWMTAMFIGGVGEDGFFINGADSTAINILNLQCDNCGIDGGGEPGLYIESGSTEDTNINIWGYRYEQNISDPLVSDTGIRINNMNGGTVNIIGCYGFSNTAAATDFIEITGTNARTNIQGVTANSNYTNVLNDISNGRVIANSTSGIPALFETVGAWSGIQIRNKASNSAPVINSTSGILHIADPANGAVNDVKIYGPTTEGLNVDDSSATGASRGRCTTESVQLASVADSTNALLLAGPGDPNGRGDASAPVGSHYFRTDGTAGNRLYIKESGTGNTGWRNASYVPITSAELLDITDGINTTDKYAGLQVYDTTIGRPLWASGSTAGATWDDAAGTTVHTPV